MTVLSTLYYGDPEAELAALKARAETRYPGTFTKAQDKDRPMTTALDRPITDVALTVTPDQLDLIRRTIAAGATADELKLFLFDCHRQGVHPLDKLLHFTKRGGKYTPITSIDFMRTRAADTGEYAGSDDARFAPTSLPHPTEATVKVWRLVQGQRCPFEATARWDEYCPPSGQDHMWRKMPHTMLGKCAEALALRKGFPRQLAGLYAREELDQAGSEAPPATPVAGVPRVDPSVGDSGVRPSGAEVSAGAARPADSTVVTDTGDELPPGFAPIDAVEQSGAFTKVAWGRDAKGGWRFYSTKLPHIANLARAAFEDQVPVLLHSKDGKYLDKVERYVAPPEDDDDPPF